MRRFLIIGFIIALLIATPLVAYFLINQKTQTKSNANPASSLSFEQLSNPAVVGQAFPIKVFVNPSSNGTSNQVSFIKMTITYDGSKLKADNNSFVSDPAFPVTLEGPTNTCSGTTCTISVTLSIGPDPTKAVNSQATVGTITFTPLAPTDANAPTPLGFASGTQILSLATSDQPAENVFTRGIPTTVTILSVADASGTPIPTNTTAPGQPTNTPVPNGSGGSGGSGGNSGGSSGGSGSTDQPPVCSNIAANKVASDASGMTYQFSATGNDPDGTVSKVTFNFGDGTVQDVTNGTGTTSVNVAAQHTYGSSGTFTVSALLTDNSGAISTPSTCTQTLTVGSGGTSSNPTTAPLATATPTTGPLVSPTKIPATGPGSTILAIGMAGAALVVVGALFFVGL